MPSWFNRLFFDSELIAEQERVAEVQKMRNADQLRRGVISKDRAAENLALISGTDFDTNLSQVGETPLQVFGTELKEQAKELPKKINGATGDLLSWGFSAVNWKVWLIIFLVLLIYTGLHRPIIAAVGARIK